MRLLLSLLLLFSRYYIAKASPHARLSITKASVEGMGCLHGFSPFPRFTKIFTETCNNSIIKITEVISLIVREILLFLRRGVRKRWNATVNSRTGVRMLVVAKGEDTLQSILRPESGFATLQRKKEKGRGKEIFRGSEY